jgi:histidyl-tRNA synthetase
MTEQGVEPPARRPLVAVVGFAGDHADRLRVAAVLRDAGLAVRPDGTSRKLGKQLEAAAKAGASWAVIVGDELQQGRVGLKNLATGEQDSVLVEEAAQRVSG